MTSERDCTETRENVSTSATSEVAAQAWDKSMWQGNAKCGNDSELTHVDMGYSDIYNSNNSNRGNHELHAGTRGLQMAENTINRTVDQLLDGNYDTNKIIKQLQGTDKGLSEATGDYKDAIKHLGASSTSENLDDLLDGRRDVMKADDKVGKAIEQLKKGDEAGAIKSLLQSLGKIDKAQDEFADAKTDEKPHRQPHGDDYYSKNDRGDFFGTNYRNGLGNKDYGRTDSGMWGSGDDDTRSFDVPNPFGGTDRIEWGSGDLNPSRITVSGPFGERATIDVDQLNRFGDKVSRVVDPIGVFPRPSELSDPKKLVKHVLDPFDIF